MTAAGVAVAMAGATLIGGIQAATAGTGGPLVRASAVPGSQLWVSAYAGPDQGFSGGNAVAVSPDGGTVFVTGASLGSGATDDYATVAVSATTGAQLWATRYNRPAGQTDIPVAIAVSPDGGTVRSEEHTS